MPDRPEVPQDLDLVTRVDELRERLRVLSEAQERDDAGSAGIGTVLHGLDEIFAGLQEETFEDGERMRVELLVRGVDAIADYFDEELDEATTPEGAEESASPAERDKSSSQEGLQQFIDAFRNEARKRLSGLSISMMGIFNESTSSEALEQSGGHLHAIRGGAAMLGLKPIAQLSGLMEQVILSMRRLDPLDRDWPTQALMRGYSLLEEAVDDPEMELDPHEVDRVCTRLQSCLDDLSLAAASESTLEETTTPDDEAGAAAGRLEPSETEVYEDLSGEVHKEAHESGGTAASDRGEESPGVVEPDERSMEQRLLVVDDVETIAASVAFVLSELDLDIDIATNGEEAFQLLQERPYSLIVSDVAMPRVDGIALTRMVRQSDRLDNIPIILLTSLDHPTERDAGLEAGANDYIIKGSIGGGELVSRVRELLKIAPYFPVREGAGDDEEEMYRILVAEDAETVAASIAFVLSEGPFDIVLARDGRDALGRLKRESFDLLISDAQMPQVDGFELIETVRKSPRFSELPIVLLTSLDSDKVRQRARKIGADRFLVKGEVGGGKLLDIVDELLGLREK
jgi:CheY-like chemotaxis protein